MQNRIQVYEHDVIKVGQIIDDFEFKTHHLVALQNYHGERGCLYFSLINHGVKFNQFVGVLQVGDLTIEVLPKADRINSDKNVWHGFLLNMLRTVGIFNIRQTGYANLRLKSNSILDLYIELFLNEVRYLQKTGLVKKYRKTEGNSNSLKGALHFSRHISRNLVHAERFYVRYTTYDKNNLFNQILYKTLKLIQTINTSVNLQGEIESLLLDFPECDNISASETLFERLIFDRKTSGYEKAINISRLLLLNYHPDIRKGHHHVIALMFDMNRLWEAYVYKMLRKQNENNFYFRNQMKFDFWKPEYGKAAKIKPDIIIYSEDNSPIAVIDTKWKNFEGRPSDQDLRQILTYNLYVGTKKSALIYPSNNNENFQGNYLIDDHGICNVILLQLKIENNRVILDLKKLNDFLHAA